MMKNSVIIIFKNNVSFIKDLWLQKTESTLCLINNASEDKTYEALLELSNKTTFKLHIIDIKKDRGLRKAVRAGIRYLENRFEVSNTTIININDVKDKTKLKTQITTYNPSK